MGPSSLLPAQERHPSVHWAWRQKPQNPTLSWRNSRTGPFPPLRLTWKDRSQSSLSLGEALVQRVWGKGNGGTQTRYSPSVKNAELISAWSLALYLSRILRVAVEDWAGYRGEQTLNPGLNPTDRLHSLEQNSLKEFFELFPISFLLFVLEHTRVRLPWNALTGTCGLHVAKSNGHFPVSFSAALSAASDPGDHSLFL